MEGFQIILSENGMVARLLWLQSWNRIMTADASKLRKEHGSPSDRYHLSSETVHFRPLPVDTFLEDRERK